MIEFFASFGSFGQGTAAWVRGLSVAACPRAVQGLHDPAASSPKARSRSAGESACGRGPRSPRLPGRDGRGGRSLGVRLVTGDAGGGL